MFKEYIEEYILKNGKRTTLFFIFVAVVFFIDKLVMGPLAAVQFRDIIATDMPRYKPMGEMLFKHGLFFWYPGWLGGIPAYAWQHSPLYILNVVSQLLPLWAVYCGMVIVTMSVAGYGMYRFLSGYLTVAGWISVVGGVSFALGMVSTDLFFLYVFSYAFPLYFAWSWDLGKGSAGSNGRIMKLIIINLIVALSYPVLTLPYFFILEVIVIALLPPEGKNTRLGMLIKTSLVWLGYIMVCLPVLYALYKYVPFSNRTYQHRYMPFSNGAYEYALALLSGFWRSIHVLFAERSLQTMTLIPLAGAVAIMGKSARVRRGLMVIAIVLFLFAVFASGVSVIYMDTIFEKMDLMHIDVIVPIAMAMTAFIAIDTVIKDRRLVKRFLIGAFAGAGYAVFAVFIATTVRTRGIQTFSANIVSGVFIAFMILTAGDKEAVSFPKWAKNPAVVFLFCCTVIAAAFYSTPGISNVGLVAMAPVLVFLTLDFIWFCKKLLSKSFIQKKGQLIGLLIIMIGSIVFFQVRFIRLNWEEGISYISLFPEVSILDKLRAEEVSEPRRPFRVASIAYYTSMVQSKGFETPDGYGALINKYYCDFFGILVSPEQESFVAGMNSKVSFPNDRAVFYSYMLGFLNIRYFVTVDDISGLKPNGNFELFYAGTTTGDYNGIWKKVLNLNYAPRPINVIRYNAAFDRWYIVKKTSVMKSDEDIASAIRKSMGKSLLDTVYYSEANVHIPIALNGELSAKDKITAKYYSPDEIRLDIEVTSPAVLVVSNSYDPNWRAYVNGIEKKIHKADIAFQSVFLENPGQNSVVLRYEDKILLLLHIFIPLGIFIYSYALLIKRKNS
ncbi:MAG: hypothetical protein HQK99_04895 [Nitrospirae bacterium]|nr:hypothetical protein [Nitrospirota bacterium]